MTDAVTKEEMIPRYKRTVDEPDEYTYDIIWIDRLTGRSVLSYDGADPANTSAAYGATPDHEIFERKGLAIDEEIPLSKAVVPVDPGEARWWRETKRARRERELEERNAKDLARMLPRKVWNRFNWDRWREGEEKILKPALESRGYRQISFYMLEEDSFGPLIRGARAQDKNGKRVRFFYG